MYLIILFRKVRYVVVVHLYDNRGWSSKKAQRLHGAIDDSIISKGPFTKQLWSIFVV